MRQLSHDFGYLRLEYVLKKQTTPFPGLLHVGMLECIGTASCLLMSSMQYHARRHVLLLRTILEELDWLREPASQMTTSNRQNLFSKSGFGDLANGTWWHAQSRRSRSVHA